MSKKDEAVKDQWAVDCAKEHTDELVPLRGFCVYLHPEHGIVHVAKDITTSLSQSRFVKSAARR